MKNSISRGNSPARNQIYDRQTGTWFAVSPEQYAEYDRWRTRIRKRQQARGRCMCPGSRWWICDGVCDDCEFRVPDELLSLDMTTAGQDGDGLSLSDLIEDPAPPPESLVCDRAEAEEILRRLSTLMPEAVRIGRLRQEGLSDAAIAEIIGIRRTTFLSRLKRVKKQLAAEYPEHF